MPKIARIVCEAGCLTKQGLSLVGDLIQSLQEAGFKNGQLGELAQMRFVWPGMLWNSDRNTQELLASISSRFSAWIEFRNHDDGVEIQLKQGEVDVQALEIIQSIVAADDSSILMVVGEGVETTEIVVEVNGEAHIWFVKCPINLDIAGFHKAVSLWHCQQLARQMVLVVMGAENLDSISSDARQRFDFEDVVLSETGRKATKSWRKKATGWSSSENHLLVATDQISHSHTVGLQIKFVGGRGRVQMMRAIREALEAIGEPAITPLFES
jgi:hypothetical protein